MNQGWRINLAAGLNLLVPGAGIILLGRTWVGLLIGVLFLTCANFALWTTLLIPDDYSPWLRGLGIGLAGGTYIGAQMRLTQTVRQQRHQIQSKLRHMALSTVRECLQREDYAAALKAIAPVRGHGNNDLLVAHRLAQILTGLNHADALAAWRHLRTLDRHRFYQDEIRTNEKILGHLSQA